MLNYRAFWFLQEGCFFIIYIWFYCIRVESSDENTLFIQESVHPDTLWNVVWRFGYTTTRLLGGPAHPIVNPLYGEGPCGWMLHFRSC